MQESDSSRQRREGGKVRPSKACDVEVERGFTATGSTAKEAEDAALAGAREAAKRACEGKECAAGQSCAYVEKKTGGSSTPLNPPQPAAGGGNPHTHTATMTTSGACQCEGPA